MANNTGISYTAEVTGVAEMERRIPNSTKVKKVTAWIMNAYAQRVQQELRQRIPRRTSHTVQTVEVHTDLGRMEVTIGSIDPVVRWLDQGTGIYGPQAQRIYPTNAMALAWPGGSFGPGGSLRLTGSPRAGAAGAGSSGNFAASIAGMPGNHFIAAAFTAAEPFMKSLLDRAGAMLFTLSDDENL